MPFYFSNLILQFAILKIIANICFNLKQLYLAQNSKNTTSIYDLKAFLFKIVS